MLLLTPGPTPLPEPVREALARPIIHHRTEEYEALARTVGAALGRVFRTASPVLAIPGSGTSAMEAAILSLLEPHDTVITLTNGRFSERWRDAIARAARRTRITDTTAAAPWGEPVGTAIAEKILASSICSRAAIVALTHCETSTTALSDLRAVARVIRERAPSALIVADCITSIGAVPVEPDEWGVDVAVCASQKALMCPPGLGLVSVGPRARARLDSVAGLAPLSLDLRKWLEGHGSGKAAFTPPISLTFGLDAALRMLEAEGLAAVWRRTALLARAARSAVEAMGLALAATAPSDSVTGFFPPEGSAEPIRHFCREKHGVLFAGGQGEWKGRLIRFSHMGAVSASDTLRGVAALADALGSLGPFPGVQPRAGIEAAESILGTIAARSPAGVRH